MSNAASNATAQKNALDRTDYKEISRTDQSSDLAIKRNNKNICHYVLATRPYATTYILPLLETVCFTSSNSCHICKEQSQACQKFYFSVIRKTKSTSKSRFFSSTPLSMMHLNVKYYVL